MIEERGSKATLPAKADEVGERVRNRIRHLVKAEVAQVAKEQTTSTAHPEDSLQQHEHRNVLPTVERENNPPLGPASAKLVARQVNKMIGIDEKAGQEWSERWQEPAGPDPLQGGQTG